MESLSEGLPADIAQQIHPDWRKNEAGYWAARDRLLTQHRNRWIAFADGTVIAAGASPVEVFQQAQSSKKHPYIICVGRESEPSRMRRREFAYDFDYPGEALPLVSVEFRTEENRQGNFF